MATQRKWHPYQDFLYFLDTVKELDSLFNYELDEVH